MLVVLVLFRLSYWIFYKYGMAGVRERVERLY